MLDINPVSVVSFANIFSHLVDCLFVLWMVFFSVAKLFMFIFEGPARVVLFLTKPSPVTLTKECAPPSPGQTQSRGRKKVAD